MVNRWAKLILALLLSINVSMVFPVVGFAEDTDIFQAFEEPITRGQFAGMVVKVFPLPTGISHFSDIDDNDPLHASISSCYSAGLMVGYGDGTFRANAPLTREHAAVILKRLLTYHDVTDETAILRVTSLLEIVDGKLTAAITGGEATFGR